MSRKICQTDSSSFSTFWVMISRDLGWVEKKFNRFAKNRKWSSTNSLLTTAGKYRARIFPRKMKPGKIIFLFRSQRGSIDREGARWQIDLQTPIDIDTAAIVLVQGANFRVWSLTLLWIDRRPQGREKKEKKKKKFVRSCLIKISWEQSSLSSLQKHWRIHRTSFELHFFFCGLDWNRRLPLLQRTNNLRRTQLGLGREKTRRDKKSKFISKFHISVWYPKGEKLDHSSTSHLISILFEAISVNPIWIASKFFSDINSGTCLGYHSKYNISKSLISF